MTAIHIKLQALALFIRKRDPRYKSHLAQQSAITAAKASGRQVPQEIPRPNLQNLPSNTYVEQDWQKVSRSADYADIDWAAAETGEDSEEWECVACGKTFRSEASWNSHERSKKHMQAVERLKREMLDEDETLGLDVEQVSDEDEDEDEGDGDGEGEDEGEGNGEIAEIDLKSRTSMEALRVSTQDNPPDIREYDSSEEISLPRHRRKKEKNQPRDESAEVRTKTEKKLKARNLGVHPGETSEPLSGTETIALDEDSEARKLEADQPQLSKREKRRAREAAKKVKEAQTEKVTVCLRVATAYALSDQTVLPRCATYVERLSTVERNSFHTSTPRVTRKQSSCLPQILKSVRRRRARKGSVRLRPASPQPVTMTTNGLAMTPQID